MRAFEISAVIAAGLLGLAPHASLTAAAPSPEAAARPAAPAAPAAGVRVAQASGAQAVLDLHNELRARHCVPPLSWSARLAAVAQSWAENCVWEHSNGDYGENLAKGSAGGYSPSEHVQGWYDEIGSYDFDAGRSRDGGPVGHFTQMIWKETTQVGCGWARCGGDDMLVCAYAPRGNFAMADEVAATYRRNVPPLCR